MAKRKKPKLLTQRLEGEGVLLHAMIMDDKAQKKHDKILAEFQEEAIDKALEGNYVAYPQHVALWIILDPYKCTKEKTKDPTPLHRDLPSVTLLNPTSPFIYQEMVAQEIAALLNAGRVARLAEED